MSINLKFKQGFTLIEMLIAIAIFVIVSVGIVALFSSVFVSSAKQSSLLADSDQARRLAFSVVNELRNAAVSSTGGYPLEAALDQTLTFYANLDSDAYVERIRYYVQNGKLYKGVLKPTGNPLSYNPVNENVYAALNNLANGSSPVFYYYDGAYNGTVDNFLAQPVNVTAVKLARVVLKIYNKAGVTNTNFYSVTASGAIRNLKTNLGD